jgi:hypothetical protein
MLLLFSENKVKAIAILFPKLPPKLWRCEIVSYESMRVIISTTSDQSDSRINKPLYRKRKQQGYLNLS